MNEPDASPTTSLKALSVKDGFRLRDLEMTRLETFADAAFAFAVTLLVVGGGDFIPSTFDEMIQAMKQVPAFAASFANIMLFWYAHHKWSRRFGLEETRSVALTLLLIFVVLVYVYPLKAIYSGAFEYFSGGYLESYFELGSIDDVRTMLLLFGLFYMALSGVVVLLNRHALANADKLSLNELERFDTITEIRHWIINAAVPLISIVLALFLPDNLVPVAGMFYSVFAIVIPWHISRRMRVRRNLS